jgi:hypothetical protein
MWLCGNFHSKPEMPFYKGLNFPFLTVLSVNQVVAVRDRIQGVKFSALGSQSATLWNKYELKVAK